MRVSRSGRLNLGVLQSEVSGGGPANTIGRTLMAFACCACESQTYRSFGAPPSNSVIMFVARFSQYEGKVPATNVSQCGRVFVLVISISSLKNHRLSPMPRSVLFLRCHASRSARLNRGVMCLSFWQINSVFGYNLCGSFSLNCTQYLTAFWLHQASQYIAPLAKCCPVVVAPCGYCHSSLCGLHIVVCTNLVSRLCHNRKYRHRFTFHRTQQSVAAEHSATRFPNHSQAFVPAERWSSSSRP